ncbi:MAG: hypothetical protein AAGC93_02000 [Cyanobacteria bacterium P01_F01_bin.53]
MRPNRLTKSRANLLTNSPTTRLVTHRSQGLKLNGLKLNGLKSQSLISGLMISLALVVGLSSCRSGSTSNDTASNTASENVSVKSDLENVETNVRITVPSGWTAIKEGQRRSTDIYAVSPDKDLYAAVLSESASVLSQFDLEDNAEQYRWLIQKELDTFEKETRTGTTTIDNDPALQYEIRGQVKGTPVVYLHTTIKGTDSYYQVVGWTTAADYSENKETLQTIIKSFRAL